MVRGMEERGIIKTPRIARAFRQVPRHMFLQGHASSAEAYEDRAIMLKYPVSSLSQPQVMAYMLEALAVEKGKAVLEIGTASGYNAALLTHLTGDPQLVYTIEYEGDLARQAEKRLTELGYQGVHVAWGDGTRGWPDDLSFHRIMVTAEMHRVFPELMNQVGKNGFLLTPFCFWGLITLMIRVHRNEDIWGEVLPYPVHFVPLRREGETSEDRKHPSLQKAWRGMGRYLGQLALDSPRLWGAFLHMLKLWLQGEKGLRPRDVQQSWIRAGEPSCHTMYLRFTPQGHIQAVCTKEEGT